MPGGLNPKPLATAAWLRRLATLGIGDTMPERRSRQIGVVNLIAMGLIATTLVHIPIITYLASAGVGAALLPLAMLYASILFLNKRHAHQPAAFLLLVFLILGVSIVTAIVGPETWPPRVIGIAICLVPPLIFEQSLRSTQAAAYSLVFANLAFPLWARSALPWLPFYPVPEPFLAPVTLFAAVSVALSVIYGLNYVTILSADAAAAEADLHFRQGLNLKSSKLGLIEFGHDGTIKYWNQAAERIFGYSASEALGMNALALRSPAHQRRTEVENAWANFIKSPANSRLSSCRRKDGTEIRVESQNIPLVNRQGIAVGVASIVRDVTADEQAQKAADQAAALYKATFDQASFGLSHTAIDGKILLCNPAFAHLLGHDSVSSVIGRNVRDWTHPDDLVSSVIALKRHAEDKKPSNHFEKRYLRADGTTVYVLISSTYLTPAQVGGDGFHVAAIQDITEKKAVETKLEANEKLLQTLIQAMPIPVFGKNIADDFRFSIWNRAAEELFGVKASDCLGKSDFDLFPKDQAEFFREKDLEIVRSAGLLEIAEEPANTATGRVILNTRKTVVKDAQDRPLLLLGVCQDITARKQAELELRQTLDAIEHTAIVSETTPDGRIIRANRCFETISGYSENELIGQNHRIIKSGLHPKSFYQDMWRTIAAGKSWVGEIQNRSKSGDSYWVHAVITPIKDYSGVTKKYLSIRFDITAQKRQQEALEQQRVMMANASKMASLGEMASGIAHEINNPLTIITGRTRLGRKKFEALPEVVEVLTSIENVAFRIARIVKGLRTFARDGSQDPMEPCSVASILSDTIELCQEKIKNSGIELRQDPVPDDLKVAGRSVQLSQVVMNLIGNALDVLVDHPQANVVQWIATKVTATPDRVEIHITDSGPGVPPDLRQKIMQPFFTTKAIGKGTGLGLSISTGIIQAHHGDLYLDETAPNTTFVISLPRLNANLGHDPLRIAS